MRRAFQLVHAVVLLEALYASSDLTVVWSVRARLLVVVALAWLIGTLYLWFRSWWRLPPYWYVTPLLWSVVLLAIGLHLPQTFRFRLLGDGAFTAYAASDAVSSDRREIDAVIGSYHVVATERVGDVVVVHADSENDWFADNAACAALLQLEPSDLDVWRPALDGLPFRHLGGAWWLVNFTTRGIFCHQMFDITLRPGSED